MRKSIFFSVMIFVAMCSIGISAQAQQYKKDVKSFTKSFQKSYNAKDHSALQKMFVADAVRVNADGTSIIGAEQIAGNYGQSFANADQTVDIKIGTITPVSDSKLTVTGTYTVTGKVKASGEAINITGAYDNVVIKENGQWKIVSMKLK
jgi:ketosteroid isomerase-like protein